MRYHTFEAKNGMGGIFGHVTVTRQTAENIAMAEAKGATIIVNTNWQFTGRRDGFCMVEKLVQVNHKKGGKPKHIIWACYTHPVYCNCPMAKLISIGVHMDGSKFACHTYHKDLVDGKMNPANAHYLPCNPKL